MEVARHFVDLHTANELATLFPVNSVYSLLEHLILVLNCAFKGVILLEDSTIDIKYIFVEESAFVDDMHSSHINDVETKYCTGCKRECDVEIQIKLLGEQANLRIGLPQTFQ